MEATKKLRGEAVELQRLYESGTVVTMENLRASGQEPPFHLQRQNNETFDFLAVSRPLPEDQALFNEVNMLLTEIRQCYVKLNKFWIEEISRAIDALKMRRVDPTDFERWKDFHANLKQTIKSWKVHCCFLVLCVLRITNRSKHHGHR